MTPAMKHEPTAGALRAARAIERDASLLKSLPELIDQETGVREVLEILENIIAEAGDLIESALSKRDCSCFITSARPQGKASMMSTRRCTMAEFVKVAKT